VFQGLLFFDILLVTIWFPSTIELHSICSFPAHDAYVQSVYTHCLQSDENQITKNSVLKVRSVPCTFDIDDNNMNSN
jgi:hypothetical protein